MTDNDPNEIDQSYLIIMTSKVHKTQVTAPGLSFVTHTVFCYYDRRISTIPTNITHLPIGVLFAVRLPQKSFLSKLTYVCLMFSYKSNNLK